VYEEFFQLQQRPFPPVSPAEGYVPVGPHAAAVDDLQRALRMGQSIVLLVGPSGQGKSHLCRWLALKLNPEYRTVYLSSSRFTTRRALLQAVLYELGLDYVGLSEQESQLRIFETVRRLQREGRRLLLILDEAELLTPRLCEELRLLVDHIGEGEARIQVLLAGGMELEEQLFAPELRAFNQRIGAEVLLGPLSQQESVEYVWAKLAWAGADDPQALFDQEALELLTRASDGNVRCLNQLADHALLVAFVEEVPRVSAAQILNALEDLKVLPLSFQLVGHGPSGDAEGAADQEQAETARTPSVDPDATDEWELDEAFIEPGSELHSSPQSSANQPMTDEPVEQEPATTAPKADWFQSLPQLAVIEVGSEAEAAPESCPADGTGPAGEGRADHGIAASEESQQIERRVEMISAETLSFPVITPGYSSASSPVENFFELAIEDRYALLDARTGGGEFEPGEFPICPDLSELDFSAAFEFITTEDDLGQRVAIPEAESLESQLLSEIEELQAELAAQRREPDRERPSSTGEFEPAPANDDWLEYDVVQPGPLQSTAVPEEPLVQERLPVSAVPPAAQQTEEAMISPVASTAAVPPQPRRELPHPEPAAHVPEAPSESPYSLLLERLRWRRRSLLTE
jgi:type II secretory pathway predicted ATPase ExeA